MENIEKNFENNTGGELFSDTPEMAELKIKILEVGVESEEFGDFYGRYQELGEQLADSMAGSEGRIALMMKSAKIIEELGLSEDAMEMYNDAYYSAQQEGLEDLAGKIKDIIDRMQK